MFECSNLFLIGAICELAEWAVYLGLLFGVIYLITYLKFHKCPKCTSRNLKDHQRVVKEWDSLEDVVKTNVYKNPQGEVMYTREWVEKGYVQRKLVKHWKKCEDCGFVFSENHTKV